MTEERTTDLRFVEDERRRWALENVGRYAKEDRVRHPEGSTCPGMDYANCVVCAWELGFAEGTVAAGAFWKGDEFFASLRAKYSP